MSNILEPEAGGGISIGEWNYWRQEQGFLGKAGVCQYCGKPFEPDQTVVLVRDWEWEGEGDWVTVCVGCTDNKTRADLHNYRDIRCEGCGQPMLSPNVRSRERLIRSGAATVEAVHDGITNRVCSHRCEQRLRRRL